MEEEPECSVCSAPFGNSIHVPLVLSCGHSLCRDCIQQLSISVGNLPPLVGSDSTLATSQLSPYSTQAHNSGTLRNDEAVSGAKKSGVDLVRCPECNVRSKAPSGGLGEFPKNIELLRCIDLLRRRTNGLEAINAPANGLRNAHGRGDICTGARVETHVSDGVQHCTLAEGTHSKTSREDDSKQIEKPSSTDVSRDRCLNMAGLAVITPSRITIGREKSPGQLFGTFKRHKHLIHASFWKLHLDPIGSRSNNTSRNTSSVLSVAVSISYSSRRVSKILGVWRRPGVAEDFLVTEFLHPLSSHSDGSSSTPNPASGVSLGQEISENGAVSSLSSDKYLLDMAALEGQADEAASPNNARALLEHRINRTSLSESAPPYPLASLRWAAEVCECLLEVHTYGVLLGSLTEAALGLDAYSHVHLQLGQYVRGGFGAQGELCSCSMEHHMSPELLLLHAHQAPSPSLPLRIAPADIPKVDAWGLGCMVGHLLVGSCPFAKIDSWHDVRRRDTCQSLAAAWMAHFTATFWQKEGEVPDSDSGAAIQVHAVSDTPEDSARCAPKPGGAGNSKTLSDLSDLLRMCFEWDIRKRPLPAQLYACLRKLDPSAFPSEGRYGGTTTHLEVHVLCFGDRSCTLKLAGGSFTLADLEHKPEEEETGPIEASAATAAASFSPPPGPWVATQSGAGGDTRQTNNDDGDGSSEGAAFCSSHAGDLEGHTDHVSALAVGGGRIFSASLDKTIRVWLPQDVGGGACACILKGHEHRIMALATMATPHRLLVASGDYGGTIIVWDVSREQPREVARWQEHKDWRYFGVVALAASADGLLYSGSGDRTVKAWSLPAGGEGSWARAATMEGHTGPVAALHVDAEVLYSGSWDGSVRLWWRADHSPLSTLPHPAAYPPPAGVRAVATCSDGAVVCGREDGTLQTWREGKCEHTVSRAHAAVVSAVLVAGSCLYSAAWDSSIRVWRVGMARLVREETAAISALQRAHSAPVLAMALHNGCLYSSGADCVIKIWQKAYVEGPHI